ncbi:hypothetical protein K2173_012547 [Erythroxylum novogranatense]|uniref:Chloride channel protein n=1 Tax=Erythroxylum novogranatense TaxID=1862640 RepID=A0AAV8TJG4_9ROSI|nr:hypothetical protein K2173_012547 [Erythroxylum novogranatense]
MDMMIRMLYFPSHSSSSCSRHHHHRLTFCHSTNSNLSSSVSYKWNAVSFSSSLFFPMDNMILSPTTTKIPLALPHERNQEIEEQLEGSDDGGFSTGVNGGKWGSIVPSCFVGVLTGVSVVLFNNGVHQIRDFFWDGIPYGIGGASTWLRDGTLGLGSSWTTRVILVPACGGFIVSLLKAIQNALTQSDYNKPPSLLQPLIKAMAACFTLGTGNSLGPEGPSVEIGSSIAKAVSSLSLFRLPNSQSKLSLLAAGSAAGLSSGFNAAVAGCFFAVESVLWPSPSDFSMSITNTTSMVIISAVIASVVSEVGLGSEPAFTVPDYDFRSPGELPLYLLLGIICGLVSLTLSKCTSLMLSLVNNIHQSVGPPKAMFPVLGGLATGIIALAYPEILYWGFENVDILLESRPLVKGLSAELLLQLVGIKIIATSLCRASGLVGGYYAPSLFIGAATGMAYGKLISFVVSQSEATFQFSVFELASPQAYGLVGMAATLAGVCQVPLTAVLLLFELTQDYRIVLPLLGAVGLSSWITSGQTTRVDTSKLIQGNIVPSKKSEVIFPDSIEQSSNYVLPDKPTSANYICEIESSLCVDDSSVGIEVFLKTIHVSDAMITRFVTVLMSTSLSEAVALMLAEKQSCAMIVDNDNKLIGLFTLKHIEDFSKKEKLKDKRTKDFLVSEMCSLDGQKCQVTWTARPSMDLLSVQMIMDMRGIKCVPVVSEHVKDQKGRPVGFLDRDCISLACRAVAAREALDGAKS